MSEITQNQEVERLGELLAQAVCIGEMDAEQALALAAAYGLAQSDKPQGSLTADLRPYPNFSRLGIGRPAGVATEEEIAPFRGQTKPDNSPVGPEDFFSSGCVLADNDLIEDRSLIIPAVELGRLKAILDLRAKGSDEDHAFRAGDCHFRLVAPSIGTDPDTLLNQHNPLLGNEPFTALVARAIFPIVEDDLAQKAAVERARRGLFQDLSITPAVGSYTCGNCGEMAIEAVERMDSAIVALKINMSDAAKEMADCLSGCCFVLRTPAELPGGYVYRDLRISGISEEGIVSVEPFEDSRIGSDTVAMLKMESLSLFFGVGVLRYCPAHGLQGGRHTDGSRVVARVTDLSGLLNVGQVSAGAINSARIVLDPSIRN